jgi:hypothetical protein
MADTATKPVFTAKPMNELPKRLPPVREIDQETADALLAIVTSSQEIDGVTVGNTATDGVVYPDLTAARSASNRARRLLAHSAVPKGQKIKAKSWKSGDGFEWAIYLIAEEKPAKK